MLNDKYCLAAALAALLLGAGTGAQIPPGGIPISRPPSTMRTVQAASYAFDPGSARELVKNGTWFRDGQGIHIYDGNEWIYTALCAPTNFETQVPRFAVSPDGKAVEWLRRLAKDPVESLDLITQVVNEMEGAP